MKEQKNSEREQRGFRGALGLLLLLAVSSTLGCVLVASEIDSARAGTSSPLAKFLSSGTIIISQRVPQKDQTTSRGDLLASRRQEKKPNKRMAPLIGYFPPAAVYLPADNETWLEIDRGSNTVTLFRGKEAQKKLVAEGVVTLQEGEFYLQHKQRDPLWYAPDDYFEQRKLSTPKPGDRLRYRKGALGELALYPTTSFAIHCGPIWTKDVGGLRLPPTELAFIYKALPVGAAIVVK